MLFTSLAAAVAVTGLAAGHTPAAQPKWQPDYSTAVRTAAAQHKPLAVFVGHGQAGLSKLVADGGDATAALGEKFVAVYVDADSPAGKPLADALKLADGLVISDHSASVAALRHHGPVAPAALASYAATFAVEQPVLRTVQVGGAIADTPVPAAAPVYAPAPAFAPAPVYAPSFGGGCANGQCGGGLRVAPNFGGGCSGGSCGGGRMGLFR